MVGEPAPNRPPVILAIPALSKLGTIHGAEGTYARCTMQPRWGTQAGGDSEKSGSPLLFFSITENQFAICESHIRFHRKLGNRTCRVRRVARTKCPNDITSCEVSCTPVTFSLQHRPAGNPLIPLDRHIIPHRERRTSRESTARILHATASHFMLRSACRCQLAINIAAHQSKNYLISFKYMVGAQGIEPWTSPV
jgi:hypothetical protein